MDSIPLFAALLRSCSDDDVFTPLRSYSFKNFASFCLSFLMWHLPSSLMSPRVDVISKGLFEVVADL